MTSFGRSVLSAPAFSDILDLEERDGKARLFAHIDPLVNACLMRTLRGGRVCGMERTVGSSARLAIDNLSTAERTTLDAEYALSAQGARGAWYLPKHAELWPGVLNLPYHYRSHPRFAYNAVCYEHGRCALAASADTVFVWALLQPFCETLFYPFELRGRMAGRMEIEGQRAAWETVDRFIGILGLDLEDVLAPLRLGGWADLDSQAQTAAKLTVLEALADQAHPMLAASYRAYTVWIMVAEYYAKFKAGKGVLRSKLVRSPHERTLSAFFGGDWRVFLDYLGEAAHPDEKIELALPEPRLFAAQSGQRVEVAASMGLPVDEIDLIASVFLGQETTTKSPIEGRVEVLRRYWQLCADLHGRSQSGGADLGVLGGEAAAWYNTDALYDVDAYVPPEVTLLPNDLRDEIDRLWGTAMLGECPEWIVSEPSPLHLLTQTMGPALEFWERFANAAWQYGPLTAEHGKHQLPALERMGTPIDASLFAQLARASSQRERAGLVVEHRRQWAGRYLDRYLEQRWRWALEEAAREYHREMADRGKSPTLKMMARAFETPTTRWCGGDVGMLYSLIGERAPTVQQRRQIMPQDRFGLVRETYKALLGISLPSGLPRIETTSGRSLDAQRRNQFALLAINSPRYLQLEEAYGRRPALRECRNLLYKGEHVWGVGAGEALQLFADAIASARRSLGSPATT